MQSGSKIVFFVKNGPKLIEAGHEEVMFTHSMLAKPQQRLKNRGLSPFLTNFGKKLSPLHRRWSNPFLYLFCQIDPSNNFVKVFPKVKEKGCKLNFWPSEMIKSGGGQTTFATAAVATAFRILYWWSQQCDQISDGCLEKFKKNILLTVTDLFLFAFFQFGLGCALYICNVIIGDFITDSTQ